MLSLPLDGNVILSLVDSISQNSLEFATCVLIINLNWSLDIGFVALHSHGVAALHTTLGEAVVGGLVAC